MINQFSKIRITDTKRCTHTSCILDELMSMYISKMNNFSINLENESVYVGSGTGYTRLLEIHLREIDSPWMMIGFGEKDTISVSKDTLIPVYDESAITGYRGFHGEIKRDPRDIRAADIDEIDGFLMCYDAKNKEPLFCHIDTSAIIENPIKVFGKWGYDIKTESGFIDVNNVSIYSK